jgi:cellobiose phosphorylase
MTLLDTLTMPVDYDSVAAKQTRLAQYLTTAQRTVSGNKTTVTLQDVANDLTAKADWLYAHLRQQEWIENEAGCGWFNGYYDDDGQRVEGDHPHGVRMTLTGQVFPLMGGVATDEQAREMIRAADRYLFDPAGGGYRLNTDFGEVLLNLGRCFGFAFGHKENGAMFSHMAVMYANALYRRGFVQEGYRVLDGIYQHSQNFAVSRMYPGIPEYVNAKGRGMYPYLTGSASWYLLTMVTEVFGVRGIMGDVVLNPKLVRAQFDGAGRACIHTLFAGKRLEVVYHNPASLEYGEYQIKKINVNGEPTPIKWRANAATLPRGVIAALEEGRLNRLDVTLAQVGPSSQN